MRLTSLLVVSMCVGALVNAAIISQSSLAQCDLGDESEPSSGDGQTCSKKMVVSMVLKGGQVRKERAIRMMHSFYCCFFDQQHFCPNECCFFL